MGTTSLPTRLDGHLHVGRKDGDEEGGRRVGTDPARPRDTEKECAHHRRHSAHNHKFGAPRG